MEPGKWLSIIYTILKLKREIQRALGRISHIQTLKFYQLRSVGGTFPQTQWMCAAPRFSRAPKGLLTEELRAGSGEAEAPRDTGAVILFPPP